MDNQEKEEWIRMGILANHQHPSKTYDFINAKKEMLNGKLYKYCPIMDPIQIADGRTVEPHQYYLDNIIDSKLYFSHISNFNDPFDSFFGYSENSIIKRKILNYMNELVEPKAAIEGIFSVAGIVESRAAISFISLLAAHPEVRDFRKWPYYKQRKMYKELLKEEIDVIQIFADIYEALKNPKVQFFILKELYNVPYALDALNISFGNEDLGIANDIFSNGSSIEKISNLYYRDLLMNIREKSPMILETSEKIYRFIDDVFNITCFSTSGNNPLLWAHYANKHKGFCIEYSLEKIQDQTLLVNLFPVIYTDLRPSISMDLLGSIESDTLISFLKKSKIWEYENEWRIIMVHLKNQYIDFDCISKVIMGCKIDEKYEAKIREICSSKRIDVTKMKLDQDYFKLIETDS